MSETSVIELQSPWLSMLLKKKSVLLSEFWGRKD